MEHYLNISTAAKLAGISRRQIQKEIKAGNLDVFEGDVSVDSLVSFYPELKLDHERELNRVERIQESIRRDDLVAQRVEHQYPGQRDFLHWQYPLLCRSF